jgi:cephalosporin hydroxylase
VSDIPYQQLMQIQSGTMAYRRGGRPLLKNPFDLALYPMLLEQLRPRTLIEIGTDSGGSALWFAAQGQLLHLELHVVTIDLDPPDDVEHPAVEVVLGDADDLASVLPPERMRALARPLLVVEDSSHQASTTLAVLEFFDPWLEPGEYIVIEDGILTAMGVADRYGGGPGAAISEFLQRHPERYEVDRALCDHFGPNATWNVDGYLRRR